MGRHRVQVGALVFALVSGALGVGCGGGESPARLPRVSDLGGPRLAHPQLQPIFYNNDGDSAVLTAMYQHIVTSSWLMAVGAEYGVGPGTTLAPVQLPEPGPAQLTDDAIVTRVFQGIADGTLPPPGADTLYIVHTPLSTRVSDPGSTSCTDFGGYHNSARRHGLEIAYAVIPTCTSHSSYTDLDLRELAASHEIIEAATDPIPLHHPGIVLRDPTSSWGFLGGEVGDLCESLGSLGVRDGGFLYQRSWSNAAAEDGDPCVPRDPPGATYYNVLAEDGGRPRILPGGHRVVQLTGWSAGQRGDWKLQAQASEPGAVTFSFDKTIINDGDTSNLDVTIPAATPKPSVLRFYVYSYDDPNAFRTLPMAAIVDDECAQFTGCEECTSHPDCGLCTTTGRCETEGADGSADSDCPAEKFATWPGSCGGFCAAHSGSCTDCAAQGGCGWCGDATTGMCLEASHNYAEPVGATCAYADWSFSPSYCPE